MVESRALDSVVEYRPANTHGMWNTELHIRHSRNSVMSYIELKVEIKFPFERKVLPSHPSCDHLGQTLFKLSILECTKNN